MGNRSEKLIANNKKAYHDYEILETYEAGIDLAGTEVKSMRMGKCSIKEAYVRIEDAAQKRDPKTLRTGAAKGCDHCAVKGVFFRPVRQGSDRCGARQEAL